MEECPYCGHDAAFHEELDMDDGGVTIDAGHLKGDVCIVSEDDGLVAYFHAEIHTDVA